MSQQIYENTFTKENKINSMLNKKMESNFPENVNKLNLNNKKENNNSNNNNISIEQYEFIFEDKNENVPKKNNYFPHFYKSKRGKKKKIKKNDKNETQSVIDKKEYYVTKKYLNQKQKKEGKDKDKDKEKKFKKIVPYNFKYFYSNDNKKLMHKSLSNSYFNNNSLDANINKMESNFMKLGKEANIYTSNANYIKNKKMLLFDKFNYDNNKYKPDRAKLFDMTRIPNFPNKNSFIYKTTKFRVGHLISNNSESGSPKGNTLFNSTSILENNNNNKYKNCLQFRNFSNTAIPYSYIDNTFQKTKRYPPSDTLYKELMEKKNETFEYYFKKIIEKDKNKKNNDDENESKEENLLYSFYKNQDNKTKINISPEIKKLYYKQMIKDNNDLNGYSPLLSKKKNNWGQPLSFPKVFSSNINFDNRSQKERYEKISESFYNLKELMNDLKREKKLNELDYIYEYALSKNIDKKYLTITNLNNFYNFLFEKKLPLDTSKSLKENIILALEFDKYKKKEENMFMKKLNIKKIDKKRYKNKNKSQDENKEFTPLMLDMDRQNKINNQEQFNISDRITIRNELKKELEQIKNEVINKQKIMKDIQNENMLKRNNNNKKELKENKSQTNIKKKEEDMKKIEEKIFDSNERLYYTWYKNQNSYNINNFVKRSKLTELYFYNRNNNKIKQNDIEAKFMTKFKKNNIINNNEKNQK